MLAVSKTLQRDSVVAREMPSTTPWVSRKQPWIYEATIATSKSLN